jgi:3-dehydroquinate synthase
MVDASLGGKTGVNLNDYKNQIGTITFPVSTIIDSSFLDTLDQEEWKNGFAEMLKHGLIADEALFNDLIAIQLREINANLIQQAASVKLRIVEDDPFEKGQRKLLNFGHTFGHALEGALMEVDPIHHGHAVAVGILVESTISRNRGMLAPEQYERINSVIRSHYVIPSISEDVASRMYKLLWNDKKNSGEDILSCLLNGIGSAIYDQKVMVEEFRRAFEEIRS